MKLNQNLLSFMALGFFAWLAVSSAVNKMSFHSFAGGRVEGSKDENFVELMDGQVIMSDKIEYKTGLLSKKQFKTADQTFDLKEVRGYRMNGVYHIRSGNDFYKRVVAGRINVYQDEYESTRYNSMTKMTESRTATRYFYQRGDRGELLMLAGQKEIKEAVEDCALAYDMADLSNSKMRKAIRRNPRYLNDIFEVYNNDCKQLYAP